MGSLQHQNYRTFLILSYFYKIPPVPVPPSISKWDSYIRNKGFTYQDLPEASRQEELYALRASDMWETLGCIEPEDRKKGLKHKKTKRSLDTKYIVNNILLWNNQRTRLELLQHQNPWSSTNQPQHMLRNCIKHLQKIK